MSGRHVYTILEFAALFVALPLIYLRFRHLIHPIPALWCVAGLSAILLTRDAYFAEHRFWGERPDKRQVLFMFGRFTLLAIIIGVFTVLYDPGRFMTFPGTRPVLWAIIMVMYPLFSAFPQGIVYRAFIFRRYKRLFGRCWTMTAVSGLAFCFAHIIFLNPVAIVLTLPGGIIFAHTYLTSASLWFSSLEHALYGDFIFTIGLGYYIYHGSIMQ